MLNNEIQAEFEIQPKQNFHYRYPSEMRMTHGVINGQIEDSYPKVILRLPANEQKDKFHNKRDFFVLCTLHRYDKHNIVLSPHLLQHKGETKLNHNIIFERMNEDPVCPTKKYWELKDYVIIRLKKDEYKNSIEKKREFYNAKGLPLPFDNLLGEINLENTQSLCNCAEPNVCLGVTIFERDFYNDTYSLIANTIYSCNIFDGDDLCIQRICNPKGSVNGGTEVTLLIKLGTKLYPQVCIKKIHPKTKETEWKRILNVPQSKIFCNHAITFTTPRYDNTNSDEDTNGNDIEVNISVVIRDSTYQSNCVKFYYVKENRKRPYRETDSEPNQTQYLSSKVSKDNCSIMPQVDRLYIDERKITVQRKIDKLSDLVAKGNEMDADYHTVMP
ncbi:hypothetical protein DOY81_002246 [Sarcophaga bullata]|nr:hypothetical protein DOY81_002246 [Sarcophaga bullata]